MRTRRLAGLLAATAASVICLGTVTGCGDESKDPKPLAPLDEGDGGKAPGDDADKETPGSGPTTTPGSDDGTPGKEVKETGGSDVATGQDAKQAKSVVTSYIKVSDKAMKNGDFAEVDKVAVDTCNACNVTKKNIGKIYGSGGKVEGDLSYKPQIDAGAIKGRVVSVSVMTWFTAYKVLDSDGKTVDSGKAEQHRFVYDVDLGSGKIVKGEER